MEIYYESELYHHGIKGQKWGVRRYQNKDGTLTAAGQKRLKQLGSNPRKRSPKLAASAIGKDARKAIEDARAKLYKSEMDYESNTTKSNREKLYKAENAFYNSYRSIVKASMGITINNRGLSSSDVDNKRLLSFLDEVNRIRWTEDEDD